MKLKVTQTDVWATSLVDRPGGLAAKLEPLMQAGVNMQFMIARRAPEKKGRGVVFLTPVKGARQLRAARKAGFRKAIGLHSVRVEGPDRRGICLKMAKALKANGINLRGFSAAAIGNRFIAHLGLESHAAANEAVKLLKKL